MAAGLRVAGFLRDDGAFAALLDAIGAPSTPDIDHNQSVSLSGHTQHATGETRHNPPTVLPRSAHDTFAHHYDFSGDPGTAGVDMTRGRERFLGVAVQDPFAVFSLTDFEPVTR